MALVMVSKQKKSTRLINYLELHKYTLLLIGILLIGFFLRFFGIFWGLPILIHPDESTPIRDALTYGQTLEFRPNGYYWPAFLSYIYFILYGIFVLALLLFGKIHSINEINMIFLQNETKILPYFYSISRIYSVILGVLTIFLIYKIVQNLFGRKEGIFSALIYAILPLAVREAHFATKDTPLTFFIVLTLFCMSLYLKESKRKYLFYAAILFGLSISSSYNAIAIFPMLLFLFAASKKKDKKFKFREFTETCFKLWTKNIKLILLLLAISLSIFLLLNPYTVIEAKKLSSQLLGLYDTAISKGTAVEKRGPSFSSNSIVHKLFIELPFALSIGLYLIMFYSLFLFLYKLDWKRAAVFFSFIILLISILLIKANFIRYLLVLMPFFSIFLGYAFTSIFNKKRIILKLFFSLVLIYTFIFSLQLDRLFHNDTIVQSSDEIKRIYVTSNHSVLATEYTPYGLRVVPVNNSLIANASYLKSKNPDFVIISSEIYGSYYPGNPEYSFYEKLRKQDLGYCLYKAYSFKYLNRDLYQLFDKRNLNMYVSPDIEIYKRCNS